MDLIGSIKHIESGLGKRKSNQGNAKSAPKQITHSNIPTKLKRQADTPYPASDNESTLGRNIDTTV